MSLVIPEHLEVTLTDRPHLDVLGGGDPWVLPDGWLAKVREHLHRRAASPPQPQVELTCYGNDSAPITVALAEFLPNLLLGAVGCLAGGWSRFDEFLVTGRLPTAKLRIHCGAYDVSALWPYRWLAPDGPDAHLDCLGYTGQVLAPFAQIPFCADRVTAMLALLRLAGRQPHRQPHATSDFSELSRYWREQLMSPRDRTVLPEFIGRTPAIQAAYDKLLAGYEQISDAVGPVRSPSLVQLLSGIGLSQQLATFPAEFGAVTGKSLAAELDERLDRDRADFDASRWAAETGDWLVRGILAEQIDACRVWIGAATQLTAMLAGDPSRPRSARGELGSRFLDDCRQLFTRTAIHVTQVPGWRRRANIPAVAGEPSKAART